MTNFSDIIKSNFLEEFTAIAVQDAVIAIALSFALSLFIVFIYHTTYGGVCYSKSFEKCLIMLTMVTTAVILVISSNVVLSLGMVGALSIVRFRTAIKEPVDTAFAFWAIATGIVCGAGYVAISVLMTLLLGLLFVALHTFGKSFKRNSYMVVIRCDAVCNVTERLSEIPRYHIKNKNMTQTETELVLEMELTNKEMDILEQLRRENGIQEITVMSSVNGSVL